ncbi:MAG TPA: hypothetical protein VMT67_12055 [Terriglobales bacterium]|nr:hypothetical protein [Terriglobales bacterium]
MGYLRATPEQDFRASGVEIGGCESCGEVAIKYRLNQSSRVLPDKKQASWSGNLHRSSSKARNFLNG